MLGTAEIGTAAPGAGLQRRGSTARCTTFTNSVTSAQIWLAKYHTLTHMHTFTFAHTLADSPAHTRTHTHTHTQTHTRTHKLLTHLFLSHEITTPFCRALYSVLTHTILNLSPLHALKATYNIYSEIFATTVMDDTQFKLQSLHSALP